jgi:hypothetical protein
MGRQRWASHRDERGVRRRFVSRARLAIPRPAIPRLAIPRPAIPRPAVLAVTLAMIGTAVVSCTSSGSGTPSGSGGSSGAGAGRAAQANFTGEAKFGLDFLQRMWNEQTKTLYYQVGTGEATTISSGITTSGGCRRRMTTTGDQIRVMSISAIPRCCGQPGPARRSALPGRAAGGRLRALLPRLPQH